MASPARKPNGIEQTRKEQIAAIDRIISEAVSNEDARKKFEAYVSECLGNGTLFEELPEQYTRPGVVQKPYTVSSLRHEFETRLQEAGDIDSKRARSNGGAWLDTMERANAEKYAIINAIRSGNGSYAEARVENVKSLFAQAKKELYDAYYQTRLDPGSVAPVTVPPDKKGRLEYKSYLSQLEQSEQSLEKEINDALRGRGIIGSERELADTNAGYMRPAKVLYEGGYLTRGMTEKTARQLLEQAVNSTETGGYTYVTYVSQCASILASDRFKASGVELYGLGSDVIWQCAKNVLKAANGMLDEYQGKHVGGEGFFGNAKMASSDKEFNDNLAALKISVNDLARPMGKDEDIFSSRAIDPQNFGASMYLAGSMFYNKLSVGARMFGNMDYSMKAGDHPTVLLNWRRASSDLIKDDKRKKQYGELKQSVEYYQGIYENLRTMLTSLYDKGDVNAGKALATYYHSNPSWEAPADIKAWEGIKTTTTQQILDEAKARGNEVSGAEGIEAVVQPGGGDAAAGQDGASGNSELLEYMIKEYQL